MLFGLDGPRATLLWWTLPTYMTLLGAAFLTCVCLLLWQGQAARHPARLVDLALVSLAFALVFARMEHVALNWPYFSANPGEIPSIASGGLSAHGAIAGAAIGILLAARWFKLDRRFWLNTVGFAVPIVGLAAWWGCAASGRAYGAEVANLSDSPSFLVWEASGDFLALAPRYAVQPIGMFLSVISLVLVMLGAALGAGGARRAGASVLLVMAASFFLGFLRGDPAAHLGGLRVDQWLDAVFALAGMLMLFARRKADVPAA